MMRNTKSLTYACVAGAGFMLAPGVASGTAIVYSDFGGFTAKLGTAHAESFESMPSAPVSTLSFAGAATADVSTSGTRENTVLEDRDGFGAVSMAGRFWKLRAGRTVIDFDGAWDAFGFWYSDLEAASIVITPEGQPSVTLDDHNPDTNHFFGIIADRPFSRVTLAWSGSRGDGIGVDDAMVGRRVPNSGSMSLAGIAAIGFIIRRRHDRRSS